jgi:DNA repair protein RadC
LLPLNPLGEAIPHGHGFLLFFFWRIGMLYIQISPGHYQLAQEDDVIAEATQIYNQYLNRGTALSSPSEAGKYIKLKLIHYEYEVFLALFLDNQHRIISCDELFRGTIDAASVYPREVVKTALFHNAAAIIFAHNHPSGVSEPSHADIAITQTLKSALDLVGIRVLDHLICGTDVYSLQEHGRL